MKILLYGPPSYRETLVKKILTNGLACRNNIIEIDNFYGATDFLLTSVLGRGESQHLDLIIADDSIDYNEDSENLCSWLRGIDASFSNNNFRLSSIPIVLCKRDINYSDHECSLYNAHIPYSENEKDDSIVLQSKRLVKKWRKEVIEDLSILEINPNVLELFGSNFESSHVYYQRFGRNADYYFTRTHTLAVEFIKSPQRLDYPWISENRILEIDRSLDEYLKIIRDLHNRNKRAFERQILHKFYNTYKFFLSRDIYCKPIYEMRYKVSSTSAYHIPDYTLPSPFPGFTATSISEIKRHDVHFEYNPKRHQDFTKYSQMALYQASKYQDDFEDARLFENKFQMDLIIGLDDRKTDFIQRKLNKHYSSINVVTHDGLLDMVENYSKRMRSLHAIIDT